MALDESSSITGRWFVDSNAPFANDELTREIRDIDMLPANELDQKLLVDGLAYSAFRIGGARLLPVEPPESYADDEHTDAFELEDPFHPSDSSVELPQNWAGAIHARLARRVERVLEAWERVRLGTVYAVRGELAEDASRAPTWRFAAGVTAAATVAGVVVCVIAGAAALGETVRADDPAAPAKAVVVQQAALQQFAVEWARSQGRDDDDMTFTMEEAGADPEPEVSAADRRHVTRADRTDRRRDRARRRRPRRR
jgi:hypothetical protein